MLPLELVGLRRAAEVLPPSACPSCNKAKAIADRAPAPVIAAPQVSIGRQLKRTVLGLSDATRIGYGVFSEKLQPGKAKDRYTVE